MERTSGATPDISMFRSHVWEEIEFLRHEDQKLPMGSMSPGRWLGFSWNHGDEMSYFVWTEPTETERAQIIVQSMVRKRPHQLIQTNIETDNKMGKTQPEQSLLDDKFSAGLNMQYHIDGHKLKLTRAGPQDDENDESAKNIPEAQFMIPNDCSISATSHQIH